MKNCLAVLLFVIASVSVNAGKKDPDFLNAIWHGALTKVALHIEDDDGIPVEKAKVKSYLGMNFRPKGKWIEGMTDTNGVFVIEGRPAATKLKCSRRKTATMIRMLCIATPRWARSTR